MDTIEILKQCSVDGFIIRLPQIQLDRNEYLEVKKSLELIGGNWKGGKTNGFIFKEDPTEYLEQLCSGEKRNLKKEFQFFGTPDVLADRLVELAEITVRGDQDILEPSAGQGAIIKAINRAADISWIDCYELMPLNQQILKKNLSHKIKIIGSDFLIEAGDKKYDRIIANPPFSKNQDIDHVIEMYNCLAPDGRLVSIMSNHWRNTSGKKETEFQQFVERTNAYVEEIPAGAFKESGTSISACIVVIDKKSDIQPPIFKKNTPKIKIEAAKQPISEPIFEFTDKDVSTDSYVEDNRTLDEILDELIKTEAEISKSLSSLRNMISETVIVDEEPVTDDFINQHRAKYPLSFEELTKYSSFDQILGPHPEDYTPKQRFERWNKVMSLDEEIKEIFADTLACDGCIHLDKLNSWCNDYGLPCSYNPVLKMLGMACGGACKSTIISKPIQLQIF